MHLILVRHADAAPADGYADDSLRPLTRKGREVQAQVAKALKTMGIAPDRIFCSPRVRAVETAQITAEGLGASEPEELRVLDGGFPTAELVRALDRFGPDGTLMCVGHEPDMGIWAAELLSGEARMRVRFRKSAVLGLSFDGLPALGGATLQYFYRPKDLVALV